MTLTKFKDSMVGPATVLLAICLVITFALAQVYRITAPLITQQAIEEANRTRSLVLPAGDTFSEVTIALPEGVSEVYRADNGAGYVVRSQAKGFDGPVVFMIGLDADGNVTGISLFDHSETPGLGTKVGEESYLEGYYGTHDPNAVDAITGATKTSNALKNSLSQAFEAYGLAKEVA